MIRELSIFKLSQIRKKNISKLDMCSLKTIYMAINDNLYMQIIVIKKSPVKLDPGQRYNTLYKKSAL